MKKGKLLMMKQSEKTQKALNLWAVILIVWSLYRVNFKLPDWFDEFVAKPFVFIIPVYYYVVHLEKQNFLKGLKWNNKTFIQDCLIGLVTGGLFMVMAILSSLVKYGRLVINRGQPLEIKMAVLFIIMALVTAISEEALSRGFILNRLYQESKNIFTSSLYASFLFFFLHVPILFTSARFSGNMIFYVMVTDLVLSLVNSLLYLERKSLMLPIMIHALYSLTFYFFG